MKESEKSTTDERENSQRHKGKIMALKKPRKPSFGSKSQDLITRLIHGKEKESSTKEFYDIIDRDINGKEIRLSKYKGKVLLVINVASACTLSKKHYADLPKLAEDYGDRGFEILAFPCNQFLRQDPDKGRRNLEIIDCKKCINWFEQGKVNGSKTREVYSYLKRELPNGDNTSSIRWNFVKFLVDHEGKPFRRYQSRESLDGLRGDVEYLLDLRGPSEMELRKKEREKKLANRSYDIFMG